MLRLRRCISRTSPSVGITRRRSVTGIPSLAQIARAVAVGRLTLSEAVEHQIQNLDHDLDSLGLLMVVQQALFKWNLSTLLSMK